jgi:hypothetical protein
MPIKQPLMPAVNCATREYLETALAIYQVRGLITQSQALSILSIWRPATFALDQRTPKSTVYVSINGAPAYIVNNRAKVSIV